MNIPKNNPIMKRLFPILLCGLASLLFGCNTTPDPVLTVTPENLAFSAEGGTQTVQVKAAANGRSFEHTAPPVVIP